MRIFFRVFRVFRGSSFPDGALTRVTADAWQRCLPGLMAAKDCLQRMAVFGPALRAFLSCATANPGLRVARTARGSSTPG